MTHANDARRRRRLDVHQLMAFAATENAADLAEHGSYQRTDVDEADAAHTAFEIGMWELSHDKPAEAKRWLTTAVDSGIDEARPLLRICTAALDPTAHDHDAVADEDDELLTKVHLAATEEAEDAAPTVQASTPIYDKVVATAPGTTGIHIGPWSIAVEHGTFIGMPTRLYDIPTPSPLFVPPPVLSELRESAEAVSAVLAGAMAVVVNLAQAQICVLPSWELSAVTSKAMAFVDTVLAARDLHRGPHLPAGPHSPARTRRREAELATMLSFLPPSAEQHFLSPDEQEALAKWYDDVDEDEDTAGRDIRRFRGFGDGQHVQLPGSELIIPASQSGGGRRAADSDDRPAIHDTRSPLVRNQ